MQRSPLADIHWFIAPWLMASWLDFQSCGSPFAFCALKRVVSIRYGSR